MSIETAMTTLPRKNKMKKVDFSLAVTTKNRFACIKRNCKDTRATFLETLL
jgi:hypothetical protein